MNILIISRHTWPTQGPRSFRCAELSEELVRQGHKVVVYAVQGESDMSVYSRETGVIVRPIEMHNPINKEGKSHRYNQLDRIKLHLFKRIADYPLMEFKHRVKEILSRDYQYDLLITIAYPHEIHFGAALAKKRHPDRFPKVWIGDCGDPFMFNPYGKPIWYFALEEKRWCKEADFITVPVEQSINAYYPVFQNKIHVIPQGFDYSKTPIAEYKKNDVPTFAYAGAFYPGLRDPFNSWITSLQ